ncbi:alcohol dehydrogenase class IV [Desulfitispora alkaliphila]|uniref:1-propanol dehydrogenase PduQ n=1 Tax=Desulfitispora alkaliphila TaxID=622674 RepID=UPI003D1BABF5
MDKFSLNTTIVTGEGSLSYVRELKAERVCIVTDQTIIKIGLLDRVTSELKAAGIEYRIFDSVEANPTLDTVQNGLYHIIDYKPDTLIAMGGGSVIDAAKAIIYYCIKTKEALVHKANIAKPFFIAIPTTSGTGSEVTSFSVITDTKTQTKIPLTEHLMLPNVAILDASLTSSVPSVVTADTGMDVITHALEAYVANSANIFTEMYARKALKLALGNLLKAYGESNNNRARQNMHVASCMAGIAFNNAGLGITHSLAHAIGGRFGVSHGRANAILLPTVIAFNSGLLDGTTAEHGVAYESLSTLLGFNVSTTTERINCLIECFNYYNQQVNIPNSFKTLGIEEKSYLAAIDEMAESAINDVCTKTNPRSVSKHQLAILLKQAYC